MVRKTLEDEQRMMRDRQRGATVPKRRMPKEIDAPPELVAAADVALQSKIHPNRAAEIIKYLMFRRTLEQNGADLTRTGLKFGMSRQAIQVAVTVLEARLT